MEAVFLAAGCGSRMRANGHDHKALRELMGVPILERGIRAFREAGIERFTIVVGMPPGWLKKRSAMDRALAWRCDTPITKTGDEATARHSTPPGNW